MNEMTCPYLGIIGPESEQIAARDYPSFENCCFSESDRTGVEPSHGALLLADQSTYCLSGGYHQCPRFQSISLQTGAYGDSVFPQTLYGDYQLSDVFDVPTTSLPLDSEYLSSPVNQPDSIFDDAIDTNDFDEDESTSRLNPAWLLAGTTFISVFLLGIALALYLGWQLISDSAFADVGTATIVEQSSAANVTGSDITLVNIGDDEQALYVVQTATPDPNAAGENASPDLSSQAQNAELTTNENAPPTASELAIVSDAAGDSPQGQQPLNSGAVAQTQNGQSNDRNGQQPIQQNFPAAVTPTAIVVAIPNNSGSGEQAPVLGANQVVQPENVTAPGNGQEQAPAFIPASPTRRPTPSEIPVIALDAVVPDTAGEANLITNGGAANETPTNTPEPTATWEPPIVFFSAVDKILSEGKCTKLTWDVQNVRAVYVASIGVDGKGEKEVCINDKTKVYDLSVVLPNGGTKLYTTTVEIELPTPTPTPTWTYTPLPIPTATWTPVPPTATPPATPTPELARGVRLDTAQPQDAAPITCSAGSTCEIGLLVTNTGEGVDSMIIVMTDRSQPAWPALLCKQDGICSADRLTQTEVRQGELAFITMRLTVPADATTQNVTYSLYAASEASGEAVRSETLVLNVAVP